MKTNILSDVQVWMIVDEIVYEKRYELLFGYSIHDLMGNFDETTMEIRGLDDSDGIFSFCALWIDETSVQPGSSSTAAFHS